MSRRILPRNTLYVDLLNTQGINPDGSRVNPFPTIQAALDFVEGRLDAAINNQYSILVAPGVYQESLIWRSPFLHLEALGGQGSVIVESPNATQAALIITNATLLSIADFYAAGGKDSANTDALITAGALVSDPALVFPNGITFPSGISICSITFTSATPDPANDFCVMYINTQNATDSTAQPARNIQCINMMEGLYWRNCAISTFQECTIDGVTQIRNSRPTSAKFCTYLRAVTLAHDAALPLPAATTSAQLLPTHCAFSNTVSASLGTCFMTAYQCRFNTVQLATTGTWQLFGCTSTSDVIVEANGTLLMQGGSVLDDAIIQNPGTCSLTLNGVFIGDDITLNAGGVKTAVMNGGQYMGALTDPDAVFVRNPGN